LLLHESKAMPQRDRAPLHGGTNDLRAGQLVTPRVRLVAPLAQGGMAELWVAEHLGLGARVVVKFMARELLGDRGLRERFRREAHAAARIKSPHVVCHLDFDKMADGVPFLVMELLEGETLRQRLDRLGPLSLFETAEVVAHVGHALGAAHAAGIVHRDVKPDNIFVTQSAGVPLCKLLDFGIAADCTGSEKPHLTMAGALIGTPFYLSRELALGATSRDRRGDLWALSVVAYECLTGRLPFGGTTVEQVVESIRGGCWLPPTEQRAELGGAVDAWFERAFHTQPLRRFASALELSASFAMLAPGAARTSEPPPHSGVRCIGWHGWAPASGESMRATSSRPPPASAWQRGGLGRIASMSLAAALATFAVEWLEHGPAAAHQPLRLESLHSVFARMSPHGARGFDVRSRSVSSSPSAQVAKRRASPPTR
jgi:eukaryotic-like serine/threonine-protein kinase